MATHPDAAAPRPRRPSIRPQRPARKLDEPARVSSTLGHLLDLYEAYDFGPDDQHCISRVRDILHAVQDGTIEDEL
jgi:hypothetical protein